MNFVDDKALAYEIRFEALIKKKRCEASRWAS